MVGRNLFAKVSIWGSGRLNKQIRQMDCQLYSSVNYVKYTLVQALRLCTDCTARSGSRGIALPFHDYDTRRWWGVSVTPRPLFTPWKDPVPIAQEAVWAPGAVWTGAENLASPEIRSPDPPARSQSLYWLRYPAHCYWSGQAVNPLDFQESPHCGWQRVEFTTYSSVLNLGTPGWNFFWLLVKQFHSPAPHPLLFLYIPWMLSAITMCGWSMVRWLAACCERGKRGGV